jgi:membrane associated rhomboid family serine protease
MASHNFARSNAILVPLIIILNVLVFGLWHFYSRSWMLSNFAVSFVALEEGRFWTLLTSVFSHNMLLHLFINMFVLNSFGGLLEQLLGRTRFLSFYLFAGAFGSLSHCLVSEYFIGDPAQMAVGASGAIAGLVLLFSLLFPRERIYVFGILPLPALFGALAFIGLDIWGLMAQSQGGGLPIGHGAHLGGALAGILFYFYFRLKKSKI